MSACTPGTAAISSAFSMPLTDSICGMMHTWLLDVATLYLSLGYREASYTPGVKVQGLKERWPKGAARLSGGSGKQSGVLTVVHLLHHVSDFLRRLDVGDDYARSASVEGGGEGKFVVLGHADDYHGLAFGVGLCGVDSAAIVNSYIYPTKTSV